ncbi:MAG: hypothetical protein HFJ58_01945 [Clostridia bacterium]|nr:hypothetical protein [Clostridia bacterium]
MQNYVINMMEKQQMRNLFDRYCMSDTTHTEGEYIARMAYEFAEGLPYSMDIEQTEFVPADFINMTPSNFESDRFFKWEDQRTIYTAMTSDRETFKSGILLQVCAIFQKMLLGQFPTNYKVREEDYTNNGIDRMTPDQDYNMRFFEALSSLPQYYNTMLNIKDIKERRTALDTIFEKMQQSIANRVGGMKYTDSEGNTTEVKPSVVWKPKFDLCMILESNYSGILEKRINTGAIINLYRENLAQIQSVNLTDFTITNGRLAGLNENEIAGILQSAMRKLPGNVPEEKYKEQIMEWINNRASRKRKIDLNEQESTMESEI